LEHNISDFHGGMKKDTKRKSFLSAVAISIGIVSDVFAIALFYSVHHLLVLHSVAHVH
jgi:hypothetical protein